MKMMLDGEYRRFKATVWIIRRLLIVMPAAILAYGLYELNADILLIASLVSIQNAVALWVIAQWAT